MDTSKKFNLSWKDFQNNVSQLFGILRDEEDFFDVTLVSSDLQQVGAHKVVLSSCSPVLKELLKSNKHSHPMLYIRGVKSVHLNYVLDYIYSGEVSIHQEHLNDFLAIADDLKLKGLSNVDGDSEDKPNLQDEYFNDTDFLNAQTQQGTMDDIVNGLASSEHVVEGFDSDANIVEETNQHSNDDYETTINSLIEKVNDHWRCKVCGKEYINKNKTSLKEHVDRHHTSGFTHTCTVCGKVLPTKANLTYHRSRSHKGVF